MEHKERVFENSYCRSRYKSEKILSVMKVTTDDDYVHDDSKLLPKLVDDTVKSKKNITVVDKIIADGDAYDKMLFLNV